MLADRVTNTMLTGMATLGFTAMVMLIFIVVAGPYLQRRSNEYDSSINAKKTENKKLKGNNE